MSKRYSQFFVFFALIVAFAFLLGQTPPDRAYSASPMVDDIIIMPRNYMFTWGSSGHSVDDENPVLCSSNPDHTRLIYWRTSDSVSGAGVNDWNPNILVAGYYRIYVFVPNYDTPINPITKHAKYYLDGNLIGEIDQNLNKCTAQGNGTGWKLIGNANGHWFNTGTGQTISMPAQTTESPFHLIAGDGLKLVYVPPTPTPTPTTVPPVTVFSGNPSSSLFFDNNGDRINLEVCANNLPGKSVRVQLSRPGQTYNVVSQQATGRCVIFWDLDGPGSVLFNTNYTTRAALNQNPNPSWPVPCYTATGGQGLCDTKSLHSGSGDVFRLPYPGGVTYRLGRNRHGNTPAYDFTIPRDHQIVATRAGTVIAIKEDSSSWACNPSYGNRGNYVFVRHADGTVARYLHLKKNGVVVSQGQTVQRGQLLGYTGLSGYMCGNPPDHLHFEVRSTNNVRTIVRFEDTNNSEPAAYHYYTSGNYFGTLLGVLLDEAAVPWSLLDEVPEGQVQFRINTNSASDEIKLLAYDYLDDVIQMRLVDSEAGLANASWIPYSDTATWNDMAIFAQYQTADGRISEVYSDTVMVTANTPIVASFELGSTEVCVGEDIAISNNTVPYCPQCSWNWNLGNGFTTQAFNPGSDENGAWWEYDFAEGYFDPNMSFDTPGVYTVSVSVENQNNSSSASRQVTVINSISADFTITRSGNTVTVTAVASNASSWEWEFGDGATATGQTATHTYASLETPHLIVLRTQAANGCTGESHQFVQNYHIFVPFLKR